MSEFDGRRPVVAILDTGCGKHTWLDQVMGTPLELDGVAIGDTDPDTDPERSGNVAGALDGELDSLAGHGTFIAGLVHQACPDAEIVSARVVAADGRIIESDWLAAIVSIAELVRRHAAGEEGGRAIDVLNLSMGYYHETPEDLLFDPVLGGVLETLGRCGTTVVCSVGNDATARPFYPAAFAPWSDGSGPYPADPDRVPVVSVGALNPNGTSTAMFSNTGPWVRHYMAGASVLSTLPAFQGGRQALSSTTAYGRLRESIDPDNFTGGFALWSGTSFAAPLAAGQIAEQLVGHLPPGREDVATAVARSWDAVTTVTGITHEAEEAPAQP